MEFHAPADLTPFEVFFDHSEPNPALPTGLVSFAGRMGFPAPPLERPWVFANFVQSIDGLVSFGGAWPSGEWIARSRHDRWMMDLLRAHADALICGAHSLRLEARHGRFPGGPVYRIVDTELLRLRQEVLGRGRLRVIIVSGSGNLCPEQYRLFRSEHVDACIATTPQGAQVLGRAAGVPLLICGENNQMDWPALLTVLRRELRVDYLLCEGGPALYGSMVRAGVMDEKFLTVSPVEVGAGWPAGESPEEQESAEQSPTRPTSFTGPGFTVQTARWYRWISCRRAGHHEFNRYRASQDNGPPAPSLHDP